MPSNRFQRKTRLGQRHLDRIAGAHVSAGEDHGHDASLAQKRTIRCPIEDRVHSAGADIVVYLTARIAQPGQLHDRRLAEPQSGTSRQSEQCDPSRGHIFAQLARCNGEPGSGKLLEQFGVDQMDLAQIRRGGRISQPGAMLHGLPAVRVSSDTAARYESNGLAQGLAEAMSGIASYGGNLAPHERKPGGWRAARLSRIEGARLSTAARLV